MRLTQHISWPKWASNPPLFGCLYSQKLVPCVTESPCLHHFGLVSS